MGWQDWRYDRGRNRPFHLGAYPLETLRRDSAQIELEARRTLRRQAPLADIANDLARVAIDHTALFMQHRDGPAASARAPLPEDLSRRSEDVKGLAYFFDAAHVGICRLAASARLVESEALSHTLAVAIVVGHGRIAEADNIASDWLLGAHNEIAELRAAEIAVVVAAYIRQLGFFATAHVPSATAVDLPRLAVLAGVALRAGDGVVSPYLDEKITLACVTTDYALATDLPLASELDKPTDRRFHKGVNGAVSGKEWLRRGRRPTHWGRFPMETLRRVDRPTTLILDDEIPRIPKRADFFNRARFGDLGPKARREVERFAFKHPATAGCAVLIQALAARQDGETAAHPDHSLRDPRKNANAIKSLGYHLGADLIGICEIPRYAWYSHQVDGTPIEPSHRYAVVMLIDQGYETMEGSSGDDWVSAAQSMRGYLRGAEIAAVMAEFLRGRGVAARAQTDAHSDVLHLPLVLWAGLGELSRIGEVVINPFLGPRFKSVLLTTDLPLAIDQPVDFGLQRFCSGCAKCARECPCDAIAPGDKVMFNGYEMWKPDVERCTQYRVTNQKGAACGRCLKVCPLNKRIDADGAILHRLGNWLGVRAPWLAPVLAPMIARLDDRWGFGARNPLKRWWLDLEIVDGICVSAQANQRELNLHGIVDRTKSTVGYYPAATMPEPDASRAVPVNHQVARRVRLETPAGARARRRAGGAASEHARVVTVRDDH